MHGIISYCVFFAGILAVRAHFHEQDIVQATITHGKTDWGLWEKPIRCDHGVRVAGFRLKVQDPTGGDDTALNGIQLACADGTVTKEVLGIFGNWKEWQYCEGKLTLAASKHVHGVRFRSEGNQGTDDDTGGNDVNMRCNEGTELLGHGGTKGTWDTEEYEECPKNTYFCGVQTRIEGKQIGGDNAALTQMKFLCCRPKIEVLITEEHVLGKTDFGTWSKVIMCAKTGFVSGFRLQVEEPQGVFDDTSLNGIQLLCKDGQPTEKIEGPFGKWRHWKYCDDESGTAAIYYVDGFNFKSEKRQYLLDDTSGDNVKMRCNNKKELSGMSGEKDELINDRYGTWDSKDYITCPYESYLCGVQARIESNQGEKEDDTGLNQIRFICCKIEAEKCPILVEPLGCWVDKNHDRTMPHEILNERDPTNPAFVGNHYIDWFNFPEYLTAFRCRCALKASNLGYKVFGIQMYAECWAGKTGHLDYMRHGATDNCIDTKYQKINHKLQACPVQTGVPNTNFVYRISSVDAECDVAWDPVGCYEDVMDVPRPVPNYEHNERDDTIPGFNNIYIDWGNWNVYHKKMICRCAEAATKLQHDIFSIQFWGECWTAFRNETEYGRDGVSTRCRGKDYGPCPCNSYHCVGMHQANYVFRLTTITKKI